MHHTVRALSLQKCTCLEKINELLLGPVARNNDEESALGKNSAQPFLVSQPLQLGLVRIEANGVISAFVDGDIEMRLEIPTELITLVQNVDDL